MAKTEKSSKWGDTRTTGISIRPFTPSNVADSPIHRPD